MKRILLLLATLLPCLAWSQQTDKTDTSANAHFQEIMHALAIYQPDTSAVPEDKTTRKIRALRALRGSFNVNEAIAYKLEEAKQKSDLPPEAVQKIYFFFQEGPGKRWLDNAIIHIYRQHFTYQELKKLVTFYRTAAGQKMAQAFPVLMLQSLKAADELQKTFVAGQP